MSTKFKLFLVVVLLMGVFLGQHWTMPALSIDEAYAACGSSYGITCTKSKSSLLEVSHLEDESPALYPYVEPDSGETWQAKAYWATTSGGGSCPCTEIDSTAYVDVDWDQSNNKWTATCTSGCDAYGGPIYTVRVCASDTCGTTTEHSWQYILEVEVDASRSTCSRPAYLHRVEYTTTSVDDGSALNWVACSEGSSLSPISQTWSVTDTGAYQFYGSFTCYPSDCYGPTPITILYD